MPNTAQGLKIGKVIRVEDPENANRILVTIPAIQGEEKGLWIKVAYTYVGDNRGIFFLPEIGDEVIVGFINDDPGYPIVIGMLNSESQKPSITAKDANNEKGILTRSKLRIHFNVNTNTITIKTPAGNSIVLDEEGKDITITDQNQNKITMQPSGISMQSATQIEIKAAGNLVLSAGGSININAAASTNLAAQATNEITGSIVKIN